MSGPGDVKGRTVTLQDVAREADVAVSTVSRALSNPDRVSRPMRERIQEVARRLGYTSARIPVRDSLLALMVSGIGNPYNAALIRGVESQARAAGSSLVVGDIADGPEVELAHIERLNDRGVDGIVLASSLLPEAELRAVGDRADVVLFNRQVPGFASVITDSRDGSRQIVEHLAALGHRSIAYLSGPPALWTDTSVGARCPKTPRDWVSRSSASARSCQRSTKAPRPPMSDSAAVPPLWWRSTTCLPLEFCSGYGGGRSTCQARSASWATTISSGPTSASRR